MGTFSKGILGGFSGKVGTVVGANWRGKDIMRSLPKKSDREPSTEQMMVRLKFKLVTQFLAPIRPVLVKYFGQPQGFKSRRNLATAYHILEAITGDYPDYAIDYQKVIVSKGELLGLQQPTATPQATAEIALAWEDNTGQGLAKADDGLLVVVYNESRGLFETREGAAPRSSMAYTLSLPRNWVGETVQCWIAFTSAEGKKCATSVFMGTVTLV
jgi:hypothetical protein